MSIDMANLDFSLAWSVAVPVEQLGAHLQTYVEMQPQVNALRLCNRFGKGPKAAITKLPVELVAEVEHHLVEHERKKHRKHWKKDFRCFEGLCKPIDHMSDSEQVDMYVDMEIYDEGARCEGCGSYGCGKRTGTTLTKREKRLLSEFLDDVVDDEGPEEAPGWFEHETRVARWEGKAGSHKGDGRGLLSTYSAALLRDFDLELWVTHTQQKTPKDGQFTVTDVYSSTVTYLTLPGAKNSQKLQRKSYEPSSWDGGSGYLPTEAGGDIPVVLPSGLFKADIVRFSRAVKTLRLTPSNIDGAEASASSTSTDEEGTIADENEDDAKADDGYKDGWAPKLRILYRHAVESD